MENRTSKNKLGEVKRITLLDLQYEDTQDWAGSESKGKAPVDIEFKEYRDIKKLEEEFRQWKKS